MRGGWIVVLAIAGCGPQVVVPEDGDDGSGDAGSSTSGSSIGSTRGEDGGPTTAPPPSTSTTMGDDPPPDPITTGSDETTTDGGDDWDMCTCEGTQVELRTRLDEGFTPADMLAHVASTTHAWTWSAIADTPDTTVQIDIVYEGGAIFDEVGGCCGNFLCVPCPYGVTIDAAMRITSADGRLDELVPATVTGTLAPQPFESEDLFTISAQVPLAALAGTLPMDIFVDRNGLVVVDTIEVMQQWTSDGDDLGEPLARLVGYPPSVVLGESPTP